MNEISILITELSLTGSPEKVIEEIQRAVASAPTAGQFKRLFIEMDDDGDDCSFGCLYGIRDETPEEEAEKIKAAELRERAELARLQAKYGKDGAA